MDRNRPDEPPNGAAQPCVSRAPQELADGLPHVRLRGGRSQTLNPLAPHVPAPYGTSLVTGLTARGRMLPLGQVDYGKSQLIKVVAHDDGRGAA